jgi:(p)ppGpp synthase/HD superfamily hydrolase
MHNIKPNIYSLEDSRDIERAVLFLTKEISKACHNKKPVLLHSLRVGVKLMEWGLAKDTVIAGFLHDLLEDTDCRAEDIKNEFGPRVLALVQACTFAEEVKDYKERWKKLLENIKKEGKDAFFIKLADQMDNLPYYMMIADEEMKVKVMWKHNFFIDFFAKEYASLDWFQKYQQMVESFKS